MGHHVVCRVRGRIVRRTLLAWGYWVNGVDVRLDQGIDCWHSRAASVHADIFHCSWVGHEVSAGEKVLKMRRDVMGKGVRFGLSCVRTKEVQGFPKGG